MTFIPKKTTFGQFRDASVIKLKAARKAWRKRTGGTYKVNLKRALAQCQ